MQGFPCQNGTCQPKCGDGICVMGENCTNCPQDCPCTNGYGCYMNFCCRAPQCGIDWACGSGMVCGQLIDCGTKDCDTVGQSCNQSTHQCEDVCGPPIQTSVPYSGFFSGNGGNVNLAPTTGSAGFSGDIIAGSSGTICLQ
jgi:hypothetical protein